MKEKTTNPPLCTQKYFQVQIHPRNPLSCPLYGVGFALWHLRMDVIYKAAQHTCSPDVISVSIYCKRNKPDHYKKPGPRIQPPAFPTAVITLHISPHALRKHVSRQKNVLRVKSEWETTAHQKEPCPGASA